MDQHAQQRQTALRQLIASDALTLELARAALLKLLDITESAQEGPDYKSYDIGEGVAMEVVDAAFEARERIGDEVDDSLLDTLRSAQR
ncbi:hypothetical protein [Streptomyces sp. NBC_01304]|uniref:hypothetical protein n=1 Tax=Streptomyces sp. NBC_01304 TaxID=2903818 RepID=UPI002E11A445|nr:hypothetical protein OG430_48700 [Streptomyces sp. NBC_01304]